MKSKLMALMFVAGVSASFGSYAVEIKTGEVISTDDCKVLGEDVTLNLSNNVLGAYECDEATSIIKLAACHTGGSRAAAKVDCASTTAQDGTVTWNGPGCASGEKYDIVDYRGFKATTQGGKVAVNPLGGNCTDGTIDTLVKKN